MAATPRPAARRNIRFLPLGPVARCKEKTPGRRDQFPENPSDGQVTPGQIEGAAARGARDAGGEDRTLTMEMSVLLVLALCVLGLLAVR
jgi:hypothetical protein